MVVPVDREVREAQDVGQEDRPERHEGLERGAVRRHELQDHDRHHDRDHRIAERLEPAAGHAGEYAGAPVVGVGSPRVTAPRAIRIRSLRPAT